MSGYHSFGKALALGALMLACIIVFLMTIGVADAATPPPVCGPEDKIMKVLQEQFHEEPTGGGGVISSGQARVEIFASADGATFTVVLFGVNKVACMVFAGVDWEPGINPAPGRGM